MSAGSSPRLRGTCPGKRGDRGGGRFIPAPAGNMPSFLTPLPAYSVHPRACGEHNPVAPLNLPHAGSSPRLRGTWLYRAGRGGLYRFIPAPAGNIPHPYRRLWLSSVHPRACGEHPRMFTWTLVPAGSSPRLRGTYLADPSRSAKGRFIPAPAGNIQPAHKLRPGGAVHPRACGEHGLELWLLDTGAGSSPRLRGTCDIAMPARLRIRFIPAPAGNISFSRRRSSHPPVHPRACGEHCSIVCHRHSGRGSSPRLRGTSQ